MAEEESYNWVPNVSVGEFRFGTPVSDYVDVGRVTKRTYDPELGGGDWYADENDDPVITVDEHGLINDILCYDGLFYRGRNLIGLHIEEVVKVLGQSPDEYGEPVELDDDDVQITAEFEDLGLQLWLRDGVAVSAVVAPAFEDDQVE